jgi:hypothetical protein
MYNYYGDDLDSKKKKIKKKVSIDWVKKIKKVFKVN